MSEIFIVLNPMQGIARLLTVSNPTSLNGH
jgi:hypothetical protein